MKFLSTSWLPVVKQAVLNGQLKEMKSGSVMIKSYVIQLIFICGFASFDYAMA
jgi:hypothetical protein